MKENNLYHKGHINDWKHFLLDNSQKMYWGKFGTKVRLTRGPQRSVCGVGWCVYWMCCINVNKSYIINHRMEGNSWSIFWTQNRRWTKSQNICEGVSSCKQDVVSFAFSVYVCVCQGHQDPFMQSHSDTQSRQKHCQLLQCKLQCVNLAVTRVVFSTFLNYRPNHTQMTEETPVDRSFCLWCVHTVISIFGNHTQIHALRMWHCGMTCESVW